MTLPTEKFRLIPASPMVRFIQNTTMDVSSLTLRLRGFTGPIDGAQLQMREFLLHLRTSSLANDPADRAMEIRHRIGSDLWPHKVEPAATHGLPALTEETERSSGNSQALLEDIPRMIVFLEISTCSDHTAHSSATITAQV